MLIIIGKTLLPESEARHTKKAALLMKQDGFYVEFGISSYYSDLV